MEFSTLLTLDEMEKKLCPFLKGPCKPRECNLLTWSKQTHRDSGERLAYCGLRASQAGCWNPRGTLKNEVPDAHARAPRAGAPVRVTGPEKNSTVVPMPPKPSKTPPTTESPTDGEII